METKRCYRCNQEKYISEFYNDRKNKDGFKSECKTCKYELYLLNKDKLFPRLPCPFGKSYDKYYLEKHKLNCKKIIL
jgi:hypothetical protein